VGLRLKGSGKLTLCKNMKKTEFDQFADEYELLHTENIRISGEQPKFFAQYKVAAAARHLSNNSKLMSLSILDFGSGVGNSIEFFLEYFPNAQITAIDVSEKSLEISRKRYKNSANVNHILFNGTSLPFEDNSFDLVFSACVFHHIDPTEHIALFTEISRVLKNNKGTFIIFEHNPLNPLTRMAVDKCAFDKNAILVSCKETKTRLSEVGFTKVVSRYTIFFPKFLSSLRILEPWLAQIPLGAQYYVAAVKRDRCNYY
jgi:ubiquinone/menaquinone biosynthesis C-methylase UbiE